MAEIPKEFVGHGAQSVKLAANPRLAQKEIVAIAKLKDGWH